MARSVLVAVSLATLSWVVGLEAQTTGILTVDARANIFGAGQAPPGGGMQPPVFSFPAGPGKVLTFSSVTGLVSFSVSDPFIAPDGDPGFHTGHTGTDIDPGGGISGIKADPGPLMFLAGVFLTDAPPAPPAPPKLDFTGKLGFTDLSPQIGQVFFVGDGLTGTGSGTVQRFYVPASATRLFLGFADAGGFHGFPGFYEDNQGSFTAIFKFHLTVGIDIKPGSFPNTINLSSGGTLPVAIFSTPSFDARTVDPVTVTLAGSSLKLKGQGSPMASVEDVNKDGSLDLVVHVVTEALQLTATDVEAVLEGMTFSGQPIRGVDTVRLLP